MAGLLTPSAPKPVVKAPAVMPTPDDASVQAAKRRRLAADMARSGRQSTIMDQAVTDKLGA